MGKGEDKKATEKRKRIMPKAPVQMIISREYVGTDCYRSIYPDYLRGYS